MRDEKFSNLSRNGTNGKTLDGNPVDINHTKEDFEKYLQRYYNVSNLPDGFNTWSRVEQYDWVMKNVVPKMEGVTKMQLYQAVSIMRPLNFDQSALEKPEWLDMEKFRKGQQFALDNYFSSMFGALLGLMLVYSLEEDIKPLIITGRSTTPYSAFQRFISTVLSMHVWHVSDPWTKGTAAYKKTLFVNKQHKHIHDVMRKMSPKELAEAGKITNPVWQLRNLIQEDFSACPMMSTSFEPRMISDDPESKQIGINQWDMSGTQFALMGIMMLFPKKLGIHNATRENLDAFCHFWRGIGYFTCIDDEYNSCRGTLEESEQRGRELLEYVLKPSWRNLTRESEHMVKCLVEGVAFALPGLTYEAVLLFLTDLLEIPAPKITAACSYFSRIVFKLVRFYTNYLSRIMGVVPLVNKIFMYLLKISKVIPLEKKLKLVEQSRTILETAQLSAQMQ